MNTRRYIAAAVAVLALCGLASRAQDAQAASRMVIPAYPGHAMPTDPTSAARVVMWRTLTQEKARRGGEDVPASAYGRARFSCIYADAPGRFACRVTGTGRGAAPGLRFSVVDFAAPGARREWRVVFGRAASEKAIVWEDGSFLRFSGRTGCDPRGGCTA